MSFARSSVRHSPRHMAAALLGTTILAGIAVPAHAQSQISWNGSVSSDWDDPANWNLNRTPTGDDLIFIENNIDTSSVSTESHDYQYSGLLVGTQAGAKSQLYINASLFPSANSRDTPDVIGAAGGSGRVDVRGAWRSGGIILGTAINGPAVGTLVVQGINNVPARLEAGSLRIGVDGGKGNFFLSDGSTALTGDVAVGDANGGLGRASVELSTWQARDITISNGRIDATASGLTARNVRINAKGQDDALFNLTASSLDADTVQIGGDAGQSGENTGITGRGTLNLDNATLTTVGNVSGIGFGAGSDGGVTMDDSSWMSTGAILLGYYGGAGSITMSQFSRLNASELVVGAFGGSASLNAFTGSQITANTLLIGSADGTGSATFDLVSSATLSQALHVGGAQLQDANGNFFVGVGQGSLLITGGSTVSANSGLSTIGIGAGSIGGVSVSGQVSALRFGGNALIGGYGGQGTVALADRADFAVTGNLTLGGFGSANADNPNTLPTNGVITADASTVETGNLTLGSDYAAGAVKLDNKSVLTVAGNLGVGGAIAIDPNDQSLSLDAGTGLLSISGGSAAIVSNSDALVGIGVGLGSEGKVAISGQGSLLTIAGTAFVGAFGGTGSVEVANNATVIFNKQVSIGYRGANVLGSTTSGELVVDHSSINSFGVAIGNSAVGSAELDNGSVWNNTGAFGIGSLGGDGKLYLTTGSVLDNIGTMTVATEAASGYFSIDGVDTGWRQSGAVVVGNSAEGEIDLTNGAAAGIDLAGASFKIGSAGGTGVVHVDGTGTQMLVVGGDIVMGDAALGGLSVRLGGTFFSSGGAIVGGNAGGDGRLAAIGEGSSVRFDSPVTFGAGGASGILIASEGGHAEMGNGASSAIFGIGAGGISGFRVESGGTVVLRGSASMGGDSGEADSIGTIDGAGSQVSVFSGKLNMTGGTVGITDGGILFTDSGANIGGPGTATPRIRISGAGSSWITAGDVYIGGQQNIAGGSVIPGHGEVYILGGGTLGGANARVSVASAGGTGTLLIDMDARASAGTYTQGVGGALMIGVDPTTNGRSGVLTSDGTITFANGTHIAFFRQVEGRYHIGDRYEIVRSFANPIARDAIIFDGLEQQSLFVGLKPVFEALGQGEALYLDVAQTRSFASVARTPNQAAAAGGADGLANANAVKAAILDLQTEDQAQRAFDSLSGEIYPGIRTALIEDSRLPRLAVLNRLTEAQGAAGAWMQGVGNWGSTDSDGNAAKLNRDTKGVLVGLDLPLGDSGLRAGLAGGYADGKLTVDARASRADLTSYQAMAYLGGNLGRVQVRLGGGYGWSKVDVSRSVAFPSFTDNVRARFDARTLQGFGEIGYRLPLGTGWVEPFAGYSAVRVQTDGFTETGGAAALSVEHDHQTATASTVGLKGSTAVSGPIVAGFTIGWQHRFDDLTPLSTMRLAGGAPFSIAGPPLAKDAALAEISIGWRLSPGTVLSARYSGAMGDRTIDNAVKAALSIAF